MVRILRVLRVFRIFRLGKRLQNEIQMRLLTLIFTLLAIIVTSAGLFYEVGINKLRSQQSALRAAHCFYFEQVDSLHAVWQV
jgi:hypothetical protein